MSEPVVIIQDEDNIVEIYEGVAPNAPDDLTTTDVEEGSNLYYTEERVSANTSVAANTAARHTHLNLATLDATTAIYTSAKDTKLSGIATGATANDTDANLKNRANHTGTQPLATISDVTASAAELNFVDGVTSAIQPQIDAKATPGDISTAISNLVDSSPATLDTLNELAAALGDDPNFATTVSTNIGTKVTGPASATNNNLASYDTTTGKLIKDSGISAVTLSAQISDLYASKVSKAGDTMTGQLKVRGNAGNTYNPLELTDSSGTSYLKLGNSNTDATPSAYAAFYRGATLVGEIISSANGLFMNGSTQFDYAIGGSTVIRLTAAEGIAYQNFRPVADSSQALGASSQYWSNLYADRHYLNSTSYFDGSTPGVALLTGSLDISAGYARANGAYNESTTSPGAYLGYGDSPRFMFANGTAAQNWQIDNSSGTFRWFLPGSVKMQLNSSAALVFPNNGSIDVGNGTITANHGFLSTVANTQNKVGLTVTQNDTTNNPNAITVVNIANSKALNLTSSHNTGIGVEVTQHGGNGNAAYFHSGDNIHGTDLVRIRDKNTSDTGNALTIEQLGSGRGIFENVDGNGRAHEIDHDGNSASAITSLWVNTANAGAGAAYAAIFEAGYVGIGTTAPALPLHISDGTISGIRLEKTGSNAGTAQMYNDGTFNIIGKGSSPNRQIVFFDQLLAGNGSTNTASNPVFGNFNDTNTGIFFPSNTDQLGITTGGTERLRVDANGFVTLGAGINGTHTLTLPSTSTGIALYNTSDQTTNFERGLLQWSSNIFTVGTRPGGSGNNRTLRLEASNSSGFAARIDMTRSALPYMEVTSGQNNITSTTVPQIRVNNNTYDAASSTQIMFGITPTISQSSTAGYTALLVNPTESTTGSGAKLLLDLQVGGASQFKVSNLGRVTTTGGIEQRVLAITSSATPTINTNLYDAVTITALATAITSMTSNLTGTPSNFDKLTFRFKDDGTARAIAWGASFASRGATLPTTTVLGKVMTAGFIYNSVTTTWDLVALAQEV